jgi:hypothetical protein
MSMTPLPLGRNTKDCPACHCWACRTALGMLIWNLADSFAYAVILRLFDRYGFCKISRYLAFVPRVSGAEYPSGLTRGGLEPGTQILFCERSEPIMRATRNTMSGFRIPFRCAAWLRKRAPQCAVRYWPRCWSPLSPCGREPALGLDPTGKERGRHALGHKPRKPSARRSAQPLSLTLSRHAVANIGNSRHWTGEGIGATAAFRGLDRLSSFTKPVPVLVNAGKLARDAVQQSESIYTIDIMPP